MATILGGPGADILAPAAMLTDRHQASETEFPAPGRDPCDVGLAPGLGTPPDPALPPDPVLPQIRLLLDPEAMTSVFERSLPADAQVPEVRIRYLRYKPATSVLVHYDVLVDGQQHEAVVAAGPNGLVKRARRFDVLRSGPRDARPLAAHSLRYDTELDVLVQWPPVDIWLPVLAEPPARLAQVLRHLGLEPTEPAATPVRLSYKPRRRAVLCFGGHVLKAYVKHADFEAAALGLKASFAVDGFRTARLEAALPTLNLTVQSLVPGQPPLDAREAAPLAARMLRALHHHRRVNGSLRPLSVQAQATAATASARLVKTILPPLAGRLDALVRRIEATAPDETGLVPSHGDFHAGQLLFDGDRQGMIDFDKACLAPPAFDLGNYAARLVRGKDGDLESASATLGALVDCYGSPSPGVRWSFAASILRRATSPFRYFHEDWPRGVEGMVEAADRALGR